MTDKTKVMQALQNCPDCSQCYTGGPGFGVACRDQLRRDALFMLKEYEKERLEWISAVAKLTAEKEKSLKEQGAKIEQLNRFINGFSRDAIPVVRCKDCKYRFVDGDNVRFNMCLLNHNKEQPDDWFCADGEQRG